MPNQKNNSTTPKVAIAFDAIDRLGGAEKVLKALLEQFPDAVVYTVRSDRKFVKEILPGIKIRNSFINYIPFEKYIRRELYLLYPIAYRLFSFWKYDVVISVSASFAKFIRPWRKKTKHIAYVLTPPRFFWSHQTRSIKEMKRITFRIYSFFISSFLEKIWQYWDKKAARFADVVVAISNEISNRIKLYYDLDSMVIYPPVNLNEMKFVDDVRKRENWFLYLGRIETYKGVELAIKACVLAHKPLKVVGTGLDYDRMQQLIKDLNAKGLVKMQGFYTDEEKSNLLSRCRALLYPVVDEDFGIIPVEANASGAPVIAYGKGGPLETISPQNPKTGVFFYEYTAEALAEILKTFNPEDFNPDNCRKQASTFASEIFKYKMGKLVEDVAKNSR